MLALTVAGFHRYYLRGVGMGERTIDPAVKALVVAHGSLATAWFVLFLVQAALIPSRPAARAHAAWLGHRVRGARRGRER